MSAKGRNSGQFGAVCQVLAYVLLLWTCSAAHASITVLMEEPYGGMGRMNPTGHSAVYLDHVCAESPLALRACHEGEYGVVISRYDGIENYDWIAIPLVPYLYAVDAVAEIPGTMDRPTEAKLREAYRQAHLQAIAPDLPDGGAPEGNWYELAGASYDRTIYAFQVNSTPDQDAELIALFNDRKNVERYNAPFRNCADFTRVTINRFYPHAIRRNFVADFGMSTPKSVARALTHYAKKHPETGLKIYRIPQVQGDLARSYRTRGIAEGLVKDYGVPLVLLSPVTTTVLLAAYIQHGRFSLPKDMPVLDFREPGNTLAMTLAAANAPNDPPGMELAMEASGVSEAAGASADEASAAAKNTLPVSGPVSGSTGDISPGLVGNPLGTPIGIVSTVNRTWQ